MDLLRFSEAELNDACAAFHAARARLTAPGAPFEVVQEEIDGVPAMVYKNAPRSLPQALAAGRVHGDKPFLVFGAERWSFARFFDAVDALAARMQTVFGVGPGDRVAIMMRNRPEWAVAFAAAATIGAVPAPINSFGLREELLDVLGDLDARLLVCDADRLARVADGLADLGCDTIVVDADPAPAPRVHGYRALIERPSMPARAAEPAPGDPALILYTSGATSRAKGVLSNQRAVCQALYNIDYIGAVSALGSPERIAAMMARGFPPATLMAVPLFHVSGLHAQLLSSLRNGRRLVFMQRWDPARAIELIREEGITQFNGAPSMVMQLLAEDGFDGEAARSLAGIGFGGAGLPQRVIDDLLRRHPDSMSGIGFGMTESNGVGTAASGDLFACKPRSSGMPSPIVGLRVAGEDGEELPSGHPGELWLRGVTLMDGYWRDPEGSRNARTDGWFRSGDVGYLDEHGFLHVVDRIKDVINRQGEKIAASEVESCLLRHPDVLEAAVLSMPDELAGEAVVAVVTARAGAGLTEAALQAHVGAHLAAYKVPARVHLRADALPRNAVGKLLKSALKDEYRAA